MPPRNLRIRFCISPGARALPWRECLHCATSLPTLLFTQPIISAAVNMMMGDHGYRRVRTVPVSAREREVGGGSSRSLPLHLHPKPVTEEDFPSRFQRRRRPELHSPAEWGGSGLRKAPGYDTAQSVPCHLNSPIAQRQHDQTGPTLSDSRPPGERGRGWASVKAPPCPGRPSVCHRGLPCVEAHSG